MERDNNRGPRTGGERRSFDGDRKSSNSNFRRNNNNSDSTFRKSFDVTCSECGKQTTVPFKHTEGRPVFCKECYLKNKPQN